VYFTLVSSKFMEIFVSLNVALVAVWMYCHREIVREREREREKEREKTRTE
jgi:hypothetical protein